jgi:acyl-coenzyme A synthetase/AMP-(fatty) acid ligase
MSVDFLLDVFRERGEAEALIWRDRPYSFSWLLEAFAKWRGRLENESVARGSVVSLEADFSPDSVALLLAAIDREAIVVPLTSSVEGKKPEFRAVAEVEHRLCLGPRPDVAIEATGVAARHPLLLTLKDRRHAGLVLFSSGSTGKSKAALHDFVPLLEKFKVRRHCRRALGFLLFDHIGGVNTLLYNLSNGGCLVTVEDRAPDVVCAAIARHRVELLPTSPTFLNLLLVSEAYKRHDLSSLALVTYGTEVMPESTLQRIHEVLPQAQLLQTYGLSELGILRSKSRSSDSLWVKIGGEGFETRVRDGLLEIKAASAMLGYLNAPSPFTEDGWFKTGDVVEVDGEWLRILGRASEIINVGGEKVHPAEVESVLQEMDGVEEVAVSGERHPLTGQIVAARFRLSTEESLEELRNRTRLFCRGRLERFKIPQKISLAETSLHGERYKKMRRLSSE